jgi:hypothetical protein
MVFLGRLSDCAGNANYIGRKNRERPEISGKTGIRGLTAMPGRSGITGTISQLSEMPAPIGTCRVRVRTDYFCFP